MEEEIRRLKAEEESKAEALKRDKTEVKKEESDEEKVDVRPDLGVKSEVKEKDSTARLYRPGPTPLVSTPISLSTSTSSSKPNMG